MKKVYSTPTVELIQLMTAPTMNSSSINTDEEIGGRPQDSNRNRGEWGNVWGN